MEPDVVNSIKKDKPKTFVMKVHGGMLETMGHNMYTSIGKSLAEFVANSYDAEADWVKIRIPFEKIAKGRVAIRMKAKEDYKKKTTRRHKCCLRSTFR